MREDMLFQERCFTLRVNGEPAEQILCSEGNWRELSVGYLLSQGRVKSSDDILTVEEVEDTVAVRLKGALRPACFLTDRLSALPPCAVKADVDNDLIRKDPMRGMKKPKSNFGKSLLYQNWQKKKSF